PASRLDGQLINRFLIQRPSSVTALHSARGSRAGRSHMASRSAMTHSAHRHSSRHRPWWDPPLLILAYATTIHKSQGSETFNISASEGRPDRLLAVGITLGPHAGWTLALRICHDCVARRQTDTEALVP